jgi:four helix bundle protein
MENFTDLKAWQRGMELLKEVYALANTFPKTELYGISSQIKRAATSVLTNIAEAHGRFTFPDKANKYTISRGECTEVTALLYIAVSLGFTNTKRIEKALQLSQETGRILSGIIAACKRRAHQS